MDVKDIMNLKNEIVSYYYKTEEKHIEKTLRRKVKGLGGMCIKLANDVNGLPDRLCCMPDGQMFFVEVKSRLEPLRPLQIYKIQQLEALGFDVHVARHVDQIDEILKKYQDGTAK